MSTGSSGVHDKVIETAEKILATYPLCDHCLGRLFAKLGLDLSNDERGRAVKTLLAMKLHHEARSEPEHHRYRLRILAENAGGPIQRLYRRLYREELVAKQCYICGGKLSHKYYDELAEKAARIIEEYHPLTFLIGVTMPAAMRLRETQVIAAAGIEYSESIKNEVKREVGKRVSALTGLPPGFDKTDITLVIDLATDTITPVVNPVLLRGRYWKKARNISHTIWATREGRKYPYSLEEFFNEILAPLYDAEKIVIHAAGREDVDARMLGTGRPLVVEIKKPHIRLVDPALINELLSNGVVEAVIEGEATRQTIKEYKEGSTQRTKIYRALVYTASPVTPGDLERLEKEMRNRVIHQLTPTRILRRKKETLRIRRVLRVKTRPVSSHVFEAIIHSSGGLYIKELISSDNGRTEPSFSSILGTEARCIELDVVYVSPKPDMV